MKSVLLAHTVFGLAMSAPTGSEVVVEASEPKVEYALVLGKIVRGSTESGACVEHPGDDEMLQCWHSHVRSKLKVYRAIGGHKLAGILPLTYIAHAPFQDEFKMIFLLRRLGPQSNFVPERVFAERFKGRSCLSKSQVSELLETGIKVAGSLQTCPEETDD